ncbi:hypothetical protein EDB19DRAFT_1913658 [Suillus lakei]|nr:hypothetical protein EDB19DRAFT_1913658 [Suillus lakei]
MNRSQLKILSQLASSPNDVASGLAQCMEALRLISSLPRSSPIIVEYSGMKGSIIKAVRKGASLTCTVQGEPLFLLTVVGLLKASMELPEDSRIMYAAFYREDGTVDPAKVLIDEDSWRELVPYVHTLHIEDDQRKVVSLPKSSTDFPNTESEWQREHFHPQQKYSDVEIAGWNKGQPTSP